MDNKFTPGPWKVEKTKVLIAGNEMSVLEINNTSAMPYWLAYIQDSDDCQFYAGNSIANANLIAAAPDMYEALKAIDDGYTRCPICRNKKGNGHDYTCLLGQALDKAERREKQI